MTVTVCWLIIIYLLFVIYVSIMIVLLITTYLTTNFALELFVRVVKMQHFLVLLIASFVVCLVDILLIFHVKWCWYNINISMIIWLMFIIMSCFCNVIITTFIIIINIISAVLMIWNGHVNICDGSDTSGITISKCTIIIAFILVYIRYIFRNAYLKPCLNSVITLILTIFIVIIVKFIINYFSLIFICFLAVSWGGNTSVARVTNAFSYVFIIFWNYAHFWRAIIAKYSPTIATMMATHSKRKCYIALRTVCNILVTLSNTLWHYCAQ